MTGNGPDEPWASSLATTKPATAANATSSRVATDTLRSKHHQTRSASNTPSAPKSCIRKRVNVGSSMKNDATTTAQKSETMNTGTRTPGGGGGASFVAGVAADAYSG